MKIINELYWRLGVTVYKNPTLRNLLKPLYRRLAFGKENKEKNVSFRNNGLKVIEEFDKALGEQSIPYVLFFGSLLGAIREKGFIKHDLDLDVAIWNEDYSILIRQSLEKAGFRLSKSIIVDEGQFAREETYEKDGIGIDIFYLYSYSETESYVCCFRNYPDCLNFEHSINKYGGLYSVQYYFPLEKKITRVIFENKIYLPIPVNAHEIMRCIYGETYMIPQPNRTPGSFKDHQNLLFNKMGKYKEY